MFSWILKVIGSYLRLCIFALGLLIGLQVPAFIDQYEKRVDAHLLEARLNLAGFQGTANRYFAGDIQKLIAYYRASDDKVFNHDANSIEGIYSRVIALQKERLELQTHPVKQAWHVFVKPHRNLFDETVKEYSYTVPINLFALIWGLSLAMLMALTIDSVSGGCRWSVRKLRHSDSY
ncbi:DUF2937 family protein [Aliiglaciecola sp. LCG003]|uniref:DUF2937 family protein n=1 Tax=Aliiglaciecola sp. LCG003 TaxID=3053655 RepID=UPI0025741077|nr:DUF2937 family protein [Aliiglaciecola sp. LCG003]WJG08883.1 DUF2937 family protein [Aliiglaciecola sp. LCG003]